MISLITGLPGNGKTLFALWLIKHKALKEGRQVFYHNIKDLTLPWTVHGPENWMDMPAGSIMVIDECQDVFPKKPNGSKLPDHYSELAKHRHKGFDIFLITQHPSLLDNFVRKLVGQHYHAIRKFGLQRSTIYEWGAAVDSPEKVTSHKNAIPLKWKFPREVFTYYKSAEVHTVKRAIPAKLILAGLFVLAVIAAGYWSLDRFQNRHKQGVDGAPLSVQAASPAGGFAAAPSVDPMADARAWVNRETARVEGLPHTAPKYDEMTKPTTVPVPAMCIRRGQRCQCYTQQATKMAVPFNQCVDIAYNGYFQEFDPTPNRRQVEPMPAVPVAVVPMPAVEGRVLAMNEVSESIPPVAPLQDQPERQFRRAIVGSVR
jgi:zona occludens toxin